jgi:hypothetical protein
MGGFDMVDYAGAEEHFVPRSFMFDSNAHSAIVIHKTAGDPTPERVLQTFLNSPQDPNPDNRNRSAHYAVGQDGRIFQFVPEELGAGANGLSNPNSPGYDPFWNPFRDRFVNLNLCTLSIEHCDPSKDSNTPLTPAQKVASFKLVAHLVKKYDIPASHIKPHKSIIATGCPGTYPMGELLQFIQEFIQSGGSISMGIPAGWHDDGTTLTAPNGHKVVQGFRKRVLAGWDPNNVPLEEEHGQNPLEEFFQQEDNKGTQQIFQSSVLCFNHTRGVFVMDIGHEFLGTRNKVKQLSDQITQLENQIAQLQKTGAPGPSSS